MKEFINIGGLTNKDIEIFKDNKNIGKNEPPLLKNIGQYDRQSFIELFGEKNINKDIKINLIKNLEKEISNLKIELNKLEIERSQLLNNGEIDKLVDCTISINEKKYSIKIRQDIIDISIDYN